MHNQTPSSVQLIVGLGNPGASYAATRHNVGAWFVEALAKQHNVSLNPQVKFKSLVGQFKHNEHACWLLIPSTFMNLSGQAVRAFASFYKLAPENMLVVHDELDFASGVIKLKQAGGHGGHNGLRDIISQLGNHDFLRLRVGIGHPGHRDGVSDYVLNKPSDGDKNLILAAIDRGLGIVPELLEGNIQKAMQALHNS